MLTFFIFIAIIAFVAFLLLKNGSNVDDPVLPSRNIEKNMEGKDAQFYYNRAQSKFGSDPQGAIADYDEVIRLEPNSSEISRYACSDGAALKIKLGDYKGAITDLTTLINIDSKYNSGDLPGYYSRRADVKELLGDYQGAIDDYTEVIRLEPEQDRNYFFRGRLKKSLGYKQDAIADYIEAISLDSHMNWRIVDYIEGQSIGGNMNWRAGNDLGAQALRNAFSKYSKDYSISLSVLEKAAELYKQGNDMYVYNLINDIFS